MFNPFSDSQLSKENAKLYAAQPQSEFTRNVNPAAQRQILLAKKSPQTSQKPSILNILISAESLRRNNSKEKRLLLKNFHEYQIPRSTSAAMMKSEGIHLPIIGASLNPVIDTERRARQLETLKQSNSRKFNQFSKSNSNIDYEQSPQQQSQQPQQPNSQGELYTSRSDRQAGSSIDEKSSTKQDFFRKKQEGIIMQALEARKRSRDKTFISIASPIISAKQTQFTKSEFRLTKDGQSPFGSVEESDLNRFNQTQLGIFSTKRSQTSQLIQKAHDKLQLASPLSKLTSPTADDSYPNFRRFAGNNSITFAVSNLQIQPTSSNELPCSSQSPKSQPAGSFSPAESLILQQQVRFAQSKKEPITNVLMGEFGSSAVLMKKARYEGEEFTSSLSQSSYQPKVESAALPSFHKAPLQKQQQQHPSGAQTVTAGFKEAMRNRNNSIQSNSEDSSKSKIRQNELIIQQDAQQGRHRGKDNSHQFIDNRNNTAGSDPSQIQQNQAPIGHNQFSDNTPMQSSFASREQKNLNPSSVKMTPPLHYQKIRGGDGKLDELTAASLSSMIASQLQPPSAPAPFRRPLNIQTKNLLLSAQPFSHATTPVMEKNNNNLDYMDVDDGEENEQSSPILNIHNTIKTLSVAERVDSLSDSQEAAVAAAASTLTGAKFGADRRGSKSSNKSQRKLISSVFHLEPDGLTQATTQQFQKPKGNLNGSISSEANKAGSFFQGSHSNQKSIVLLPQLDQSSHSSLILDSTKNNIRVTINVLPPETITRDESEPKVFLFPPPSSSNQQSRSNGDGGQQQKKSSLSGIGSMMLPSVTVANSSKGNTPPTSRSIMSVDEDGGDEGEFVMKKNIDFDKLRDLRDRTINRSAKPTSAMRPSTNQTPSSMPSPNLQPRPSLLLSQKRPPSSLPIPAAVPSSIQVPPAQVKKQPSILKQLPSAASIAPSAINSVRKNQASSIASTIVVANKLSNRRKQQTAQVNSSVEKVSATILPAQEEPVALEQQAKLDPVFTATAIEEHRLDILKESDKNTATKLEGMRDKVRYGLRQVVKEFTQKKAHVSVTASTWQSPQQQQLSHEEQNKEMAENLSAIYAFFISAIDSLNYKEISDIPSPNDCRVMRSFSVAQHEQFQRVYESELRRSNTLTIDEYERFKWIYETTTKMKVFYADTIATLGGLPLIRETISTLIKRMSSHVSLFPINYVYGFDSMERKILPGVCAMLCGDSKLCMRTIRKFLAQDKEEFSYIDFFFLKKELDVLLQGLVASGQISQSLAFAVLQKIESTRRYIFPNFTLDDAELRQEVAKKLSLNPSFMDMFKPESFSMSEILTVINQVFDYLHSDAGVTASLAMEKFDSEDEVNLLKRDKEVTNWRVIKQELEKSLKKRLSRKVIDYIEVVTQSALQQDRFTRNVIVRDLHYKFTKLRLKLGFKQGIFDLFSTEQVDQLLVLVSKETAHQVEQSDDSSEVLQKALDFSFLSTYMRFLLSEYDVFSVYDFSVAIPYFAVSSAAFKLQISCLKTVLLNHFHMPTSKALIFLRYIEACCPAS